VRGSAIALQDAGVSVLDCEHKTPPAQTSGHPYIAIPDIQGGRVILDQARLISTDDLAEWTRRTVPTKGDILVTRRGRVGDTAPVPEVPCAIGQNLVLLRSDGTNVDANYLRWAVRSPEWWGEVERLRNVGAVFSSLNVKDIGRIRLSFPPLSEQQAIAEVLGALDDKIAANVALAAIADSHLSTLFDKMVDGAGVARLGSIADVNRAAVKPVAGGSLRYVDIASVAVGSFDYPTVTPWNEAPGRARRGLSFGDTIWSTVRPNRRSHALNLEGDPLLVASTGLAIISPREVGFAYLYEATRRPEFSSYLETVAEGSAYPAVRADRFLDAPVPDLPVERIADFESQAAPLRKLVASQGRENRTLAATRDALLPQLMSGKLRVRDAEDAASALGV